MDLNLQGHVAVVTGGASGIGRAVARGLLAEGCRVAIWDTSPKTAEAAAEIASSLPLPNTASSAARVLGIRVDVTSLESVQQARDETERVLGPVEHLVHAAAIGSGKFGFPFTNLEPADWLRVWEVNVQGMVHVAHALAP